MLDKKDFEKIRKELDNFEEKRERLIQNSRAVITLSKRIIYSLHRNDMVSAEKLVKEIEKKKLSLGASIWLDTNINQTAYQEYAEAICYYHFIIDKKIPPSTKLKISNENYLMGLCDLTGELGRKAVNEVINKNFNIAVEIKDLVSEIYGEFLKFNLRNGELRKKSDQIKWNLKKLEDIVYDLKVKARL
jgi:translin